MSRIVVALILLFRANLSRELSVRPSVTFWVLIRIYLPLFFWLAMTVALILLFRANLSLFVICDTVRVG